MLYPRDLSTLLLKSVLSEVLDYALICEVDDCLFQKGSGIALVQELYATNGCRRGLPTQMQVFADTRCNAAMKVNNFNIECQVLCAYP